uniref:AraC family transcriptional regulator n=1 Tax=Acetatifactor sp. TaxID=1872090 RepID=UPI004057BDCA
MRERAQRFDPRQTMHCEDFEIFHYREPKPEEVEVHHHDFYEVYFFLSGEVEYWVEGRIFHLLPGDLLLINPMELHRPIVTPNCSVYERIVLWIHKGYMEKFSDPEINLTRCFDHTMPTHTNLLRPTTSQRSYIMSRMGELVHESYSSEFGSKLCASGIFLQLMVEINRMALTSEKLPAEREEPPKLIAQVLSYINEHYKEDLSLEGLATQFFVSKYHLSHEFTAAVGVGVYRYIMLKRLLMARQLLTDGTSPGEVCASCGFHDYTNFYRAFKAEYGISPSACASAGK